MSRRFVGGIEIDQEYREYKCARKDRRIGTARMKMFWNWADPCIPKTFQFIWGLGCCQVARGLLCHIYWKCHCRTDCLQPWVSPVIVWFWAVGNFVYCSFNIIAVYNHLVNFVVVTLRREANVPVPLPKLLNLSIWGFSRFTLIFSLSIIGSFFSIVVILFLVLPLLFGLCFTLCSRSLSSSRNTPVAFLWLLGDLSQLALLWWASLISFPKLLSFLRRSLNLWGSLFSTK